MRHIVITGATGIIGLGLVRCLLRHNIKMTLLIRPNSRRENALPKSHLIKKVYCCLEDINKLSKEAIEPCDVFYHLAWEGAAFARNNVKIQMANIKYTLDAIHLAARLGAKFIGVGSQAEYGIYNEQIKPESIPNPTSAYGIAKMTAQKLGERYAEQLGVPFIWTRVFSIYGPYDLDKTVIMSCIRTLYEQRNVELTRCEQMWDFLYVDDAAEIYYQLGICGKNGRIYNISSGKVCTLHYYMEQVYKKCQEIFKTDGKPLFGARDYEKNQTMFLGGDVTNLQEDIGYIPMISFEEGIKKTILWYMEEKTNEKSEYIGANIQ